MVISRLFRIQLMIASIEKNRNMVTLDSWQEEKLTNKDNAHVVSKERIRLTVIDSRLRLKLFFNIKNYPDRYSLNPGEYNH
jgi:hypothetical protein